MSFDELKAAIRGTVVTEAEPSYADAQSALIWNGRKPAARPTAIVRVASVEDVQATVRFAASQGLVVSPRGSGHNFSGIAAQEGLVLDLSALNEVVIDAEARIAEVGPTVSNGRMAELLAERGLAFPVGHCSSVGLSGYLLGGGFGWNSGEWGMACHSVESADVVLADGRLVTASANDNPELFWALRGAGPAFFGVVVRYRLRLQQLRAGMMSAIRVYPLDRIDEVSRWMAGVMAVAPQNVEFTTALHSAPPPNAGAKVCTAVATVFAETPQEAREALEGVAIWAPAEPIAEIGPMPMTYGSLYAAADQSNPAGARYAVEALWTDDPRRAFRILADQVAAAPSPLSYALANVLPARSPVTGRSGTAFSRSGAAFGALYGVWTDPAGDASNIDWLRAGADALAPFTVGHYVGEADLARPGRLETCYSPETWERLKLLRANYDPTGVFRREIPRHSARSLAVAAE